ncbi:MAG: replication-associated recombination protein A [Andreesenia angusta]|nr:replication-associated recombination protein A [Andreesenia angusta]
MDLLDYIKYSGKENRDKQSPLADRMRPQKLEQFIGQEHIVGKGKLLYRTIKADKLSSLVLYGPPGTGKTSLAKIISNESNLEFRQINATIAGIKDIREVIEFSQNIMKNYGKRTILFIDEIHRFNKSQQDALLKYIEDGSIILVGATTENPYFEVNKALLSRAMVLELKPLENEDIKNIIKMALKDEDRGYGLYDIYINEEAIDFLIESSSGDARIALNALELAVSTTNMDENGSIVIDIETIEDCIQKKMVRYEKNGDEHYDTASALIKSIRGSDPDAALYWLGKMLYAGEDIKFIARRLIISASEDIGNADPNALNLAVSAFEAINIIGMPEARIVLSQITTYLATAPKSNSSYMAINRVMSDMENKKIYPVPNHLKDSHYKGAKDLGRGRGYIYPHDSETGYIYQEYLPKEMLDRVYYEPKEIGYEKEIIDYISKLKDNK